MYKLVYSHDYKELTISTNDLAKMFQETYVAGFNKRYELSDDIGNIMVDRMIRIAKEQHLEQRIQELTERCEELSGSLNAISASKNKQKRRK
jgi:hypothetical protein